jgi:hypothetical protein
MHSGSLLSTGGHGWYELLNGAVVTPLAPSKGTLESTARRSALRRRQRRHEQCLGHSTQEVVHHIRPAVGRNAHLNNGPDARQKRVRVDRQMANPTCCWSTVVVDCYWNKKSAILVHHRSTTGGIVILQQSTALVPVQRQ